MSTDRDVRDQRIHLVLTIKEKEIIENFAANRGMTLAAWIRDRIFYAADSFVAMQKLHSKSASDSQG